MQDAWLEAYEADTDIDFDNDAMNPHFAYLDENNVRHDVWFLDGVTALNQMRAAQALGIDTFALWRLGSEDRSLWAVWDKPGEAGAPQRLSAVPPGQDVDIEGKGEILRIQSRPWAGERKINVDPETNLVTDEIFQTLPDALCRRYVRRHAAKRSGHHLRRRPRSASGRRRSSTC